MLETIPIYELPFKEPENSEFRIYKVRGKHITSNEFPHKTILPHKHRFYEICIFTGGTGEHDIDFKTYPITPPSIHLVYPGQVHLIHRGNNYQGYLIIFSREFLNLHFKNPDIIPGYSSIPQNGKDFVLNFNKEEFEDFSIIVSCIEKEIINLSLEHPMNYRSQKGMNRVCELATNKSKKTWGFSRLNGTGNQNTLINNNITKCFSDDTFEIIVSFLTVFFLRLRSKYAKQSENNPAFPEPGESLSQSFQSLLENNYTKCHRVKDYAEQLGSSVYILNKTLKIHTGKTAGELIIDRIILEAKRLLTYSDMNNKEIAYLLNYDDPSYFSRIFRSKTGTSPSQFRNEINNRYKI